MRREIKFSSWLSFGIACRALGSRLKCGIDLAPWRVQQDETGPDDEKKNACSNSPTQQKDTLKYVSSVRAAKKRKNKVH